MSSNRMMTTGWEVILVVPPSAVDLALRGRFGGEDKFLRIEADDLEDVIYMLKWAQERLRTTQGAEST